MGNKIFRYDTLVHNAARLAKLSQIMQIPIIATQFTSFGPLARPVVESHDSSLTRVFVKKTFSVFGDNHTIKHLKSLKRRSAVVYGFDTVECII